MHLSLPNLHFSSCQNALIILTQLTRTDMIVVDPFVQMLFLSTIWSDKYFLRREAFGMSERLFYCIRMRAIQSHIYRQMSKGISPRCFTLVHL